MLCNNCGKEIDDQATLCPHCGTSIKKLNSGQLDGPVGGLGVLCFLIPVVGLILHILWKDEKPVKSKGAGKAAIWGFIIFLIVPSVIIVGVAVAVGVNMMSDQAMLLNRDALVCELSDYGATIMAYHKKPVGYAGGGNNVTTAYTVAELGQTLGWTADEARAGVASTENGTFTLTTAAGVVTIVGVGIEKGLDGSTGVTATNTITLGNREPNSIMIDN